MLILIGLIVAAVLGIVVGSLIWLFFVDDGENAK